MINGISIGFLGNSRHHGNHRSNEKRIEICEPFEDNAFLECRIGIDPDLFDID